MGKLVRLLERIAAALEVSAKQPRTEPQAAKALVDDLEARVSALLVQHEQAISALKERSPPNAEVVARVATLEVEFDKQRSRINSLNGRVSRAVPKAPPPVQYGGILLGGSQPAQPADDEVED